jgi:ATP-dependent DNA ligase
VSLVAFDLLELDGDDVRNRALIERKKQRAKIVSRTNDSIEFAEHLEGNGADIHRAACEHGHEGVVILSLKKCNFRVCASQGISHSSGEAAVKKQEGFYKK